MTIECRLPVFRDTGRWYLKSRSRWLKLRYLFDRALQAVQPIQVSHPRM